jgi:hypothetical protein
VNRDYNLVSKYEDPMSKRGVLLLAFVCTVFVGAVVALAQTADPWFGTWKQNLAKSTYNPGPQPKNAALRTEEPWEGGLKSTVDGVDPDGTVRRVVVAAKWDGKFYPVTGLAASTTTRAYTRINQRTISYVTKVDGKELTTVRTVVSSDGKTATTTVTGKNAQGQDVHNTITWDRQ